MRTDELRNVLHARADDVPHTPAGDRVGQVRGRVATVRRRRAAATGGGVVAAVAVAALAVLPGLGTPAPAPAGSTEGVLTSEGYTKDGVTYRPEVLGERLLGAVISDPGEPVVGFEMTVPRTGLRISPTCYGVGLDHIVRISVDGHLLTGSACHEDPAPDPGKDGNTWPDGLSLDRMGIRPGDVVTVQAALAPTETSPDTWAADSERGVVGVGIYEDTRPRTMVGGVEVPELIEHDGIVWELAWTYESDPGSPSLWVKRDPERGRELIVGTVSGVRGPSRHDFLLDDEVVSSSETGRGVTGPSWEILHVFEHREGGSAELRVTRGLTKRTRVAFGEYQPVD